MVRILFLLLSVFGTTLGTPKRCCYPRVWNAIIAEMGGVVGNAALRVYQSEVQVYWDTDNQKWGFARSRDFLNGDIEQSVWMHDYEKHEAMIFHQSKCHLYPLDPNLKMVQHCIPENATYLGEDSYGHGDDQFVADRWYWRESRKTEVYGSVVSDTCMPVSEVFVDYHSERKVLASHLDFVNLTIGHDPEDNFFNDMEYYKPYCRRSSKMPDDYRLQDEMDHLKSRVEELIKSE